MKHYTFDSNGNISTLQDNNPAIGTNYIVCIYNNEIHELFTNIGINDLYYTNGHYKYSGSNFEYVSTPSFRCSNSHAVNYNGNIYLFYVRIGNSYDNNFIFQSPEKVYNPNTLIINRGDSCTGSYLTAINDNSSVIKGNNNRFVSGFDDCFYYADTAFDWNAPMYYGNGSQWIRFKN